MLKRGLLWGAALLVGFAGSTLGTGSVVRSRELPPLIPREVLFGNPQITSVNLSPDGRWISYLAPYQGVLNLWVRDLDGQAPARVITQQRDRPQMPGYWTADGRFLISFRDGDGDENTVLVRIDPRTGETQDLTPAQGVKAVWIGADRDAPNELLVALNDRIADGRDVSWIWDVDWEPLLPRIRRLTATGERAHDLALRFRYAGISPERLHVQQDPGRALDDALAATPRGGTLQVLPTYTAMHQIRADLVARGAASDFWEAG